ncbi:MAG: Probable low-affinity inorganic phosphate transporter, partial [uncultured Nocardioides sp.]
GTRDHHRGRRRRPRLRLHQRLPRRRQRDRHLGVDAGADAAGGAGDGRRHELRRRLPGPEGRPDGLRHHLATDGDARADHRDGRAARRDHVEHDHLVLRPAVVVLARPHRRTRRLGDRLRHDRALEHGDRQGRHPDDPVPAGGVRARLRGHAGGHVDLPRRQPRPRQPRLPDRPDRLGRRDGAGPRPAGRPEDDGRDLPGAPDRRVRRRVRRPPPVGDHRGRHRHLAGHLVGRLAHHAHPRPPDHPPRPASRLRRRVGRRLGALHHGVRLGGADLHDPHHHLRGDGRRGDQALLGRALGCRSLDPHRLGPDLPDGRAGRRPLLRRGAGLPPL